MKIIKQSRIKNAEVRLEAHEDYWLVCRVGVPKTGKHRHVAFKLEDAERKYDYWVEVMKAPGGVQRPGAS